MSISSEHYENELSGITSGSLPRADVTVKIGWSHLLDVYAETLIREIERMNPLLPNLPSVEEFKSYLFTLLKARIDAVTGDRNPLVKRLKVACVPILFYQMIVKIGTVQVKDFSLTITPIFDPGEDESDSTPKLMGLDEFIHFSNDLLSLQDYGLAATDSAPTTVEGEVEFMSGLVLDQQVVSLVGHNGSPATGFLIALANNRLVEGQFRAMFRTWYGDLSDFAVRVSRITIASNKSKL